MSIEKSPLLLKIPRVGLQKVRDVIIECQDISETITKEVVETFFRENNAYFESQRPVLVEAQPEALYLPSYYIKLCGGEDYTTIKLEETEVFKKKTIEEVKKIEALQVSLYEIKELEGPGHYVSMEKEIDPYDIVDSDLFFYRFYHGLVKGFIAPQVEGAKYVVTDFDTKEVLFEGTIEITHPKVISIPAYNLNKRKLFWGIYKKEIQEMLKVMYDFNFKGTLSGNSNEIRFKDNKGNIVGTIVCEDFEKKRAWEVYDVTVSAEERGGPDSDLVVYGLFISGHDAYVSLKG